MGKSSKLIKCLILGAKAFSKHDEKDKLTKPKGKWSLGKPYSCIRDPNDDSQDQLHSENIVQIEHGISENGFSSATNSDLQPGITLTKPIEENSNIGLSNTLAKPDDSEEIAEDEGPVMENNGGVSAEDHAVTLIQAAFRGFLEDWDHSTATVDELQAKIQNKQDAAMRRERALAYAFSQQLRICAQRENRTAVDCVDPEQPHLGWTWLERWMAARPSDKTEPEDDIMTMHLDANKHDKPLHGKSEKKKTTVTQPSPSPTRSMARNSIATGLASTTHCSLSRSPNKSGHESPLPARAINNCRDSEICHMGARKALTGNENENDGYVNEENCGSYGICAVPELAVTSTSTDASKLAGGRFKSSRSGSTNLRVPNYMSTTQSYKAKSTSPITPPNHTT